MKKYLSLILTVVLVTAMFLILVACDDGQTEEYQENQIIHEDEVDEQQDFINALVEFRYLAITVGTEAESLSGHVRSVWSDAIREELNISTMMFTTLLRDYEWDEVFQLGVGAVYPLTAEDVARISVNNIQEWNDFNTALSIMSGNDFIIDRRANIESGRNDVSSLYWQLGSAPEGLERAEPIVSAMFESLDRLVSLANNPTGSLTSFSDSRTEAVDEFMRNYRLLGDMINAFNS